MERLEDALIAGQIGSTNSNNQNGDINNSNSSNSNNNPNVNNGNISNTNNNNNISTERPIVSYTMPGILHYLQHEWNRYELDRQQWEVEKAELMTKISFLQGERRGQENLKNNLVRRIKMLELALKQERIKYHKLKFGTEPNQNDFKNNPQLSNITNDNDSNDLENNSFSIAQHPILNKENTVNSSTKQGRQILKQYLQEIGYTDTIIDVRSARLRTLLGLKSSNNNSQNSSAVNLIGNQQEQFDLLNASNLLNGNKQLLQLNTNKYEKRTVIASNLLNNNNNSINACQSNDSINTNDVQSMLMMTNLDFLSSQLDSNKINRNENNINSNNNDEDIEEINEEYTDDTKSTEISKVVTQTISNNLGKTLSQPVYNDDVDTEDALKEFAFLSNELASSGISNNDDIESDPSDWNMDKAKLIKLTEQYKKDRKSSKISKQSQPSQNQQNIVSHAAVTSQRPNKATLQAMIANLNENPETTTNLNNKIEISKQSLNNESSPSYPNQLNNINKIFIEEDGFASDSSLGELSRISVGNNHHNNSSISDETIIDTTTKKTISNKFSLRGHFDSIRCLAFHPTESALLTGSEDQTIKLWNLDKSSISNKKNANADIESVYTFRKHSGPVLSLVMSANGDYLFSSGLDSKIMLWNMPNFETIDQYDAYSSNIFVKHLNGHTDAVWKMIMVDNTLVSISADSTIRVWNPFGVDELDDSNCSPLLCLNESKKNGLPTSIDFINNEKSKIVTSFDSSYHNIYDLETSKVICKLDFFEQNTNTYCYKVLNHSTSSLILSAHEDKKIRFFDINSGKIVNQLVAHQDACTYLAIDPTNLFLLSASHDCSLRLWNLETKNCIQEMTAHRKKNDESIHCVAFHSTKPYIASGGADAIVKIYV